MNIWQLSRQFEFLVGKTTWEDGTSCVFASGSVIVSEDSMEKLIGAGVRPPIAVIRVEEAGLDPDFQEEPDLQRYSLDIEIATTVDGDRRGENPILGAHASGVNVSEGRGVLEISGVTARRMKNLTTEDGVEMNAWLGGKNTIEEVPGRDNWVSHKLQGIVRATLDRFYHPPIKMKAVDAAGAGEADITWRLPPPRYDTFNVQLVRKAGAVGPVSATDGTIVLTTVSAISFTDIIGSAGTFTYGLFGSYDQTDEPPDSQDIFSDPKLSTVVVT